MAITDPFGIRRRRDEQGQVLATLAETRSHMAAQAQTIEHMRTRLAEREGGYSGSSSYSGLERAWGLPNSLAESTSGYSADTELHRRQQDADGPWQRVGGLSGGPYAQQVRDARAAWRDCYKDYAGSTRIFSTAKHLVRLHADYAFGGGLEAPTARNDEYTDLLSEWWWYPENQQSFCSFDAQKRLSASLLVDGELFLACYASTNGRPMLVRIIDPLEIQQAVVHPDDAQKVLYWERRYAPMQFNAARGEYEQVKGGQELRRYYTDIDNSEESEYEDPYARDGAFGERLAVDNSGQPVKVLHIAPNALKATDRGTGIMYAMIGWELMIMDNAIDQATISKATAGLMNILTVAGGQDNVDAAVAHFGQSGDNPSTFASNVADVNVMNDQAKMTVMRASSQSAEATENSRLYLRQEAITAGCAPHYAGDPENANLATATAMESPQLTHFQGYQGVWTNVITRLGQEAIKQSARGSKDIPREEMDVFVPMPNIVGRELKAEMESIELMEGNGWATKEQAAILAHTAIGAADVTSEVEKAMEAQEEKEAEETEAPEQMPFPQFAPQPVPGGNGEQPVVADEEF